MATKFSDLELAINSLVTEFHQAAGDAPTMNTTQFQSLLSKQMPALSKTVESQEGLGNLLKKMGVENGQNISFENFWNLINSQAGDVFTSLYKPTKCSCRLL